MTFKHIFMVSAIRSTGGVIGIAAYEQGGCCPPDSKHMLMDSNLREQYFQRLDRIRNRDEQVSAWEESVKTNPPKRIL